MTYKKCLLGLLLASQSALASYPSVITKLESQMIKNYNNFESSVLSSQKVFKSFCSAPTQKSLVEAQSSWLQSFQAHQKAKVYNFGPYYDEDYDWKFQFWPDKRGRIPRMLTNILKNPIEDITFDLIENGTVLTKGFPALEILLHNKEASFYLTPEGEKNCKAIHVITEVILKNITKLQSDFKTYRVQFKDSINGDEEKQKFFMNKLAESIVFGIDTVKKSKLGLPLGLKNKRRLKPMKAEAWRSRSSYDLATSTFEISLKLWKETGISSLHDDTNPELAKLETINSGLENSLELLRSQTTSLYDQVSSVETAQPAKDVYNSMIRPLSNLKRSVSKMGFTIGFNNQDGD